MSNARRIQDAILERYHAGDLNEALRAQIESTLASSPADQARLDELRADSRAFLISNPPGPMVARAERELARHRRWRWSMVLVPLAAVGTAAVALVFRGPVARGPALVAKGRVSLTVYRHDGETSARLGPDDSVKPGDAIRFEVRAPTPGYIAVIGHDATGAITVYHPYGGRAAAKYDPGAPLLSTTIELDEAPGPEHLYALFATEPFDLEPAVRALRAGQSPNHSLRDVAVARQILNKR